MQDQSVYTAAVSRSLDSAAAKSLDISGYALMERAGLAALDVLGEQFGAFSAIWVLCGKGNNAGDGYILAAHAHQRGLPVRVFEIADTQQIEIADTQQIAGNARSEIADTQQIAGDARSARNFAVQVGVECVSGATLSAKTPPVIGEDIVIVDALLGTGFRGALQGEMLRTAQWVNDSAARVLAIDVPTGVNSDTGAVGSDAIQADITVTFIGIKRGCVTGSGKKQCGALVLRTLGVPVSVFNNVPNDVLFSFSSDLLPVRPVDGHKGDFGHLVIVGGDTNMGGAIILAATAGLRVGCGLVTVITRSVHRCGLQAHRPEVMMCAADDSEAVAAALNKADCVLVGPGLGTVSWGKGLLTQCLEVGGRKVLDADALNILSTEKSLSLTDCVITPHPGEAARLLQVDITQIQQDRFQAAAELATKTGAVIVLKGPGTLVVGEQTGICRHGNSGMASAGMGDVLAGVVGSFIAQGLGLETAARVGVALHSAAADAAVHHLGERSLLAGDVTEAMMALLVEQ